MMNRRTFMRWLGLAPAAAVVAAVMPSDTFTWPTAPAKTITMRFGRIDPYRYDQSHIDFQRQWNARLAPMDAR